MVLELWEMQTALFRIWTLVAEFTSCDDNHYAITTSVVIGLKTNFLIITPQGDVFLPMPIMGSFPIKIQKRVP